MASVYDLSAIPSSIPSVSACWRMARSARDNYGEQLDYYYELLEEYGHRREGTGKW